MLLQWGTPVKQWEWEDRLGLPRGSMWQIVSDAIGPGCEGGRSEAEIWGRVCSATGVPAREMDSFRTDLFAHEYVHPEMRSLVDHLRWSIRVGVLTNSGPDYRQIMNRKYAMETWVDAMIVSAEEGFSKPDPRIYAVAADRLGLAPDAITFVDDKQANVEGAVAAGMEAILFETVEQVVAALTP